MIKFFRLKTNVVAYQYNGSGVDLGAISLLLAPIAVTVNFNNHLVINPDETCDIVVPSSWVIKTVSGHYMVMSDKDFKETFQEM